MKPCERGLSVFLAPSGSADTDELIALAKVAARHNGMYISHMRSEGDALFEAVDELITISREAGLPAAIYHLKASGQKNWWKMDSVIAIIELPAMKGLR